MIIFIYSLLDPDTLEIRYIGKTNNLTNRFKEHHQEKRLEAHTHKNIWIKSLLKQEKKAKIQVIEECNENNWQEREIYWIDFYKKQLVNYSKGGVGVARMPYRKSLSKEQREELSKKVLEAMKEPSIKAKCRIGGKTSQGRKKKIHLLILSVFVKLYLIHILHILHMKINANI